jgi:glycosyltransferase involved in cell wall biosynthesis
VKVLVLHQHFNTPEKGGALRSYYLAKGMVDAGHQVIVITGHNLPEYRIAYVDGIEVHYLPVAYDNSFGFYRRVYSFLNYAFRSVHLSRKFKGVDVCYGISVPLTVGLVAIYLKSRYRIPFIFEVGDLWPDAPIQLGFVKNSFVRAAMLWLERTIYKRSDAIVALSKPIAERIKSKLAAHSKRIVVLPNMADTDFYTPQTRNALLEEKFGVANKFVVSYVGAIGYANGLDFIISCARASAKMQLPVHFIICGEGAMLPQLKRAALNLQITNLSFIPFANREGVREVLNVTDASFVSYRPVEILETGSPNKYFDGLAGGKLIVINFGGWIKEEIENLRCGVYIDPGKPEDFVSKLTPFINDKSLLTTYQSNARKLAETYSRDRIIDKLLTILSGVRA